MAYTRLLRSDRPKKLSRRTHSLPNIPIGPIARTIHKRPAIFPKKQQHVKKPDTVSPCDDTSFTVVKGQLLDSVYRDVDKIGEGAFGSVFATFRKSSPQLLVKKVIAKSHPGQAFRVQLDLVRKEVFALRSCLGSLNVTNVVDQYEHPGAWVIITEYAGINLADYIRQKPTIVRSIVDIRDIMSQLLNGVAFINNRGFLHRDIKPENICLRSSPSGLVLTIIDLGLAVKFGPRKIVRSQAGTTGFMAPETFGPRAYGTKADGWSCGVCLLTLLGFFRQVKLNKDFSICGVVRSTGLAVEEAVKAKRHDVDVLALLRALLQPEPENRMDAAQAKAECRLFKLR